MQQFHKFITWCLWPARPRPTMLLPAWSHGKTRDC